MDFAYTAGFELTYRFGRLAYRASEMIEQGYSISYTALHQLLI